MFKIQEKICLSPYTNYKIGGDARYFCKVRNKRDIKKALFFAQEKQIPIFLLGGGTNILVSDQGFNGLVIRLELNDLKLNLNKLEVGSGVRLTNLVEMFLKKGLGGLEWAAGIPGTVGGAIRGNAGAFGESMADIVETVEAINTENLEISMMKKKNLQFGYRKSLIKIKNNLAVLNVNLKLKKLNNQSDKDKSLKKIKANIAYRRKRQPLKYPSCGSVFKGIEQKGQIIPAGFLIEKAGLAGRQIGKAQISKKHANFIVNLGNAQAKDVYALIKLVQDTVFKKFQLKLELEVKLVGF
jgi:UDP-N-acetylmuramate dehydrogenase